MARAWMFNGHGGAEQEEAECTASMDSWKMRCEGKWSSQGAGRETISMLSGCLPGPRASAESHTHTRALHLCQFIVKSSSLSWCTQYNGISKCTCSLAFLSLSLTDDDSVVMADDSVLCYTKRKVITRQMIKCISSSVTQSFVLISHGFYFCSLKLSSSAHTEISLDRSTTPH